VAVEIIVANIKLIHVDSVLKKKKKKMANSLRAGRELVGMKLNDYWCMQI
jgi:hypothetical protein